MNTAFFGMNKMEIQIIEKVANGYIVKEHIGDAYAYDINKTHVFNTLDDMFDYFRKIEQEPIPTTSKVR